MKSYVKNYIVLSISGWNFPRE